MNNAALKLPKGVSFRKFKKAWAEALEKETNLADYFRTALEENNTPESFVRVLKDVVVARGVTKIAKITKLNRANLYKMLSSTGNPTLNSLYLIINALGLQLVVKRTK